MTISTERERCISSVNSLKLNIPKIKDNYQYFLDLKDIYSSIGKMQMSSQINQKHVKNSDLLGINFHTVTKQELVKIKINN